MATEQQQLVSCKHTVTKGCEGKKGSWCVDCGMKVWEVDPRECQDCKHYFKAINYTGCQKHLMAVLPSMQVTYKIEKGSCWEGT